MAATEATVAQFRKFRKTTGYKMQAEQKLDGGVTCKGKRPICTGRKPMVWIHLQQKDDELTPHP
jgi:hypothetical protein